MSLGDKQLKYVEPTQYIPATSMSKRDFFAGLAMQGLLSGNMGDSSLHQSAKDWVKDMSEASVEFADALIAELDK